MPMATRDADGANRVNAVVAVSTASANAAASKPAAASWNEARFSTKPGVSSAWPSQTEALGAPWVDLVRASIRKANLVDALETIKVEPASLGDDAGVLGAALLASEQFGNEKPPRSPRRQNRDHR